MNNQLAGIEGLGDWEGEAEDEEWENREDRTQKKPYKQSSGKGGKVDYQGWEDENEGRQEKKKKEEILHKDGVNSYSATPKRDVKKNMEVDRELMVEGESAEPLLAL